MPEGPIKKGDHYYDIDNQTNGEETNHWDIRFSILNRFRLLHVSFVGVCTGRGLFFRFDRAVPNVFANQLAGSR
ncbi:MAG: hypothetical protein HKN85_09385 [Gammaproteobacteria bacterium]|nr:hypothetical protein [Gammaproteobacteria bacterium]